jgi:hypothetical protein
MGEDCAAQTASVTEHRQSDEPAVTGEVAQIESPTELKPSSKKKKKSKCTKTSHKTKSKKLDTHRSKTTKRRSSSEESTDSSDSSDSLSSDSDASSDNEKLRKKRKAKKERTLEKKAKAKKSRKHRKIASESESESTESEDSTCESSSDEEPTKRKKVSKKKRVQASDSESEDSLVTGETASLTDLQSQLEALKLQLTAAKSPPKTRNRRLSSMPSEKMAKTKKKSSSKRAKDDGLQFKRVDHLWDATIHNWKIKESAEDDDSEFAEYAFLVRRCFDWENKYSRTEVDIKSKQLRAVLAEVMKECKSVSLEAEEPIVDPNTLFLYLESLRTYYKKTLKAQIKAEKKRKVIKKLEKQRSLCKTLVKYLDDDYADIKRTLYPLIAAGNITFDLLWALYHPNDIAVTSCYGHWDEPRCFKIDYAMKNSSMMRGEWYCVEGKYMEYDGKNFGFGNFEANVEAFKGPRKITSLQCYPLKYHRDPSGVKKQIIERGRQFVSLEGMQYRFHKGLAFHKKKKQVLKICINGRVMVDPATFRRINPNYPISFIKPHEDDELSDYEDENEDDDCSCCADCSDDEPEHQQGDTALQHGDHERDGPKTKTKYVEMPDGSLRVERVEVDEDGQIIRPNKVADELAVDSSGQRRKFTEEELLLTSPIVYGFAFNEKLWLEFTISGVREIDYNEAAFESLVLPTNQKSIVRALVESHKFHAAKTIDDVVQGKGKGLVAVLHGPPGTGKTLTAEGISELLRCPLYMVSAGELGTDPAKLELELQKILDIAHSWGSVLLLDEADVFLEKREVHDIHRNALVSIFLRLLEYFQGILFLTTNRVETFDDAFQSRIHVALRYGDLTTKAKRTVWSQFIEMCRVQKGCEVAEFSDKDLDALSRHQLNGRQIKNIVRTAQALALNEGAVLGMAQVKRVMEVAESFERDLKGGTGYVDAMRSYT